MAASPIDAVLIHAVYLLNCASEDPRHPREVARLADPLAAGRARQIGASGVVLHPGSAKTGDVGSAIARAGETIREALAESEGCPLHLENTAGAGGTLGPLDRRARRAARGAPAASERLGRLPGLLPPVRLRL